jgi:hypothetical protein
VLTFADNQRAKGFLNLHGISGKPHQFSRLVHPPGYATFLILIDLNFKYQSLKTVNHPKSDTNNNQAKPTQMKLIALLLLDPCNSANA